MDNDVFQLSHDIKKNSLKQVLPTTSTLDKRSFTTAIFEEF